MESFASIGSLVLTVHTPSESSASTRIQSKVSVPAGISLMLNPSTRLSRSLHPPNYNHQPVLVLELPRELVLPTTSCRYYKQPLSDLHMNDKVSFERWRFIGRFLIVHTQKEQVSLFIIKFCSLDLCIPLLSVPQPVFPPMI